jgi:hypothetical protein
VPKQAAAWLEPVLTQGLCRVAAPEPLWDRVQLPGDRRISAVRPMVSMWFACTSAAALLLASAVGLHDYLRSEGAPGALRAMQGTRLQTMVSAACHLCHAGDDLQVGVSRGVY